MLCQCSQVVLAVCALVGTGGDAVVPSPDPPSAQAAPDVLQPPTPSFQDVTISETDSAPLLDNPFSLAEAPRWYGSLEIAVLKPHITDRAGPPAPVPLAWALAPKIMVGRPLPNGYGNVELTYRGLGSSATEVLEHFDALGGGVEKSRLDIQTLALDYLCFEAVWGAEEISRRFRRQLIAGFGAGSAVIFNDSRAAGREILDQHISTFFWGLGPRGIIQYNQPLGRSPFGVYVRSQAEGLYGEIRTRFSEAVRPGTGPRPDVIVPPRSVSTSTCLLSGELGANFVPPRMPRLRLHAGCYIESWWFLGSSPKITGSQVLLQGLFMKTEIRY